MEIVPVNPEWIHSYLLEPYLQGVALFEFAWTGKDNSLIPREFSWQKRVVFWLQGMALLTPIIGTIIWIAWQTFGNPQLLVDPYSPEVPVVPQELSPRIEIQGTEVEPLQPIPEGHTRQPEQYAIQGYNGLNLKTPAYQTNWKIQYFPDLVFVTQVCNNPKFGTSYIYSPCLLYTSPSPRDRTRSRMPSSA